MSTITNGNTGSPEADELRREIELQRSALGRDLEALGDHVSPGRMVQRRRNAASQRIRGMKDKLMGVADDAGSSMSERAGEAGASLSEHADAVRERVAHAPDAARHTTQGNPLAMGLISFGVGLVAASLLPPTRQERQLAARAEPQLRHAAEEAGSMARQEAEELVPAARQAAVDLRDDAMDAANTVKDQASQGMADVQEQAKGGAQTVADQAKPQ